MMNILNELKQIDNSLTEIKNKLKPQATIYAGTEDYVEFFETIISTLGLNIDYKVEVVDGEYEIVVGG